jgi:transposase-like protein
MTDTKGFPKLRALPECKEPPWFFIAQLYQAGSSVVDLAKRFGVNERQLRQYLAKHAAAGGKTRSDLEVKLASNQVRDDLVSSMLKASAALKSKEAFTRDDVATLEKLTNTATKLFAWPAPKPVESSSASGDATDAINIGLLRLSPEQIRNASSG